MMIIIIITIGDHEYKEQILRDHWSELISLLFQMYKHVVFVDQ